MRKTETVLELERAYGKSIEQIVVDAYNHHGSISAAADALGVSPSTFYSWVVRCRIELRGRAHLPESVPA